MSLSAILKELLDTLKTEDLNFVVVANSDDDTSTHTETETDTDLDMEDQEHDNIPTENAENQQDVMHELISDTNSKIVHARKRALSGQQIQEDEIRATTKRRLKRNRCWEQCNNTSFKSGPMTYGM